MEKMLLLCIWLSTGAVRCEQPDLLLSATEGETVSFSCPYDSGYESYPKYLYKGDYGKRQNLIQTTGKKSRETTQRGRYALNDDTKQRTLRVTIQNVNLQDGGTYWCEIDTYGFNPRTEIELKVQKAPPPPKPPLVAPRPPVPPTVQTLTRRTTVSENVSSTTLWSTSPEDGHTVSSPPVLRPPAGKELYLAVAAAAAALLLPSLLVVLYVKLMKHRPDTPGAQISTSSMLTHEENPSWGQLRELDPSVSSSVCVYTTVVSRRGPGVHTSVGHPVTMQSQMANPEFSIAVYATIRHPEQ